MLPLQAYENYLNQDVVNSMKRQMIHPHGSFKRSSSEGVVYFCPKCGYEIDISRRFNGKLCKGKFVIFGEACPESEHFHRKCSDCGGTWCESTYMVNESEVKVMLANVFVECEKLGLGKEDVNNVWDLRIISICMKE